MDNQNAAAIRALVESTMPFDKGTNNAVLRVLDDMGFFTAPASTKYHGAFTGGLAEHSYQVYLELRHLTDKLGLKWGRAESVWIVAMLHDLCKCDQYVQTEAGYEYRKDCLLWGHGEKSVMLLNLLPIRVTEEEITCIRYHMGAFTEKELWKSFTGAIAKYENVLWTHTADMAASHVAGI